MQVRPLFITIILLLVAIGLQAGTRTKEEMTKSALAVLVQHAASRTMTDDSSSMGLEEYFTTDGLSILGRDDLGFAIVTADDRFRSVIGFSTTPFSGELPDGLHWWLDMALKVVSTANEKSDVTRSPSFTTREPVGPLMTTKWGQSSPYNAQLSNLIGSGGNQFMTGCVATAMAQVMNYHHFPSRAYGSVRYYLSNYHTYLSHTFGDIYDWERMADSYSYLFDGAIDSSAMAVSVLMRDCGVAVRMNYGPLLSTADNTAVVPALTKYFCYDEAATRQLRRADYTPDEWMQLLYDELSHKRPVIYSGVDNSNEDRPLGHTFVVHGINSDGLVCVNWGWWGNYDGYYDLDLLQANGASYNDDQDMILMVPGTEPAFIDLSVKAEGSGGVFADVISDEVRNATKKTVVKQGSAVTLTMLPDRGYRIASLIVDGDDVTIRLKDKTYIIESMDANTFVEVNFGRIVHTVSVAATGEGTVTCGGVDIFNDTKDFSIERDSSAIIRVTPAEGWQISRLSINGSDVSAQIMDGSYVIAHVTTDTRIVAEFARRKYLLTYLVDGAEYKNYILEYGSVIIPDEAPKREGYTFSGWSEIPSLMPAENVAVTGTFSVDSYEVSFLIDGEVYQTDSLPYQSPIVLPSVLEREGYSFSWGECPTVMPAFDVIVNGGFCIKIYALTILVDGEIYEVDSLPFQSPIFLPTIPEREGYDFTWDEYPTVMPAYDVVVSGTYTVNVAVSSSKFNMFVRRNQGMLHLSGLLPNEDAGIYRISGEKLVSGKASVQGELMLPVSDLPRGVYVLRTKMHVWKVAL